ncbi:MAG: type II toxin-antitoxin system RelB/DinJ family antitoxin [Candidatus Ornithomonoglobus sp.]
MATTNVTIRMDKALKQQSEELFSALGLNLSTAIGVFCRQAVRQGKIPFELAVDKPNSETIAAMQEVDDMLSGKIPAKKFSDIDELFEDLDS